MGGAETRGVVGCPVIAHKVVGQTVDFGLRHDNVGGYTASVAHDAPAARRKDACQAVGNTVDGAVGVSVAVVDSLNEASARDIVFCHGHLQHIVVGKIARYLHEPFAERARADDNSAVEILNCPGKNLAGRGCPLVDEHGQRKLGVDRLVGGLVDLLVGGAPLIAHSQHLRPFGQEISEHLHGAFDQTAAVVAQINYQSFQTRIFLKIEKRIAEFRSGFFVESGYRDIADRAAHNSVPWNRIVDYPAALYSEGLHRVGADIGAPDRYADFCSGLPFQSLRHLIRGHTPDTVAVDHDKAVAGPQTGLGGGRACRRLGDECVASAGGYIASYSGILTRRDSLESFAVFLRDIFRVGVNVAQHPFDGGSYGLVGVDRVDIEGCKLLIEPVEHCQIARHIVFARPCHGPDAEQGGGEHSNGNNKLFHRRSGEWHS